MLAKVVNQCYARENSWNIISVVMAHWKSYKPHTALGEILMSCKNSYSIEKSLRTIRRP